MRGWSGILRDLAYCSRKEEEAKDPFGYLDRLRKERERRPPPAEPMRDKSGPLPTARLVTRLRKLAERYLELDRPPKEAEGLSPDIFVLLVAVAPPKKPWTYVNEVKKRIEKGVGMHRAVREVLTPTQYAFIDVATSFLRKSRKDNSR